MKAGDLVHDSSVGMNGIIFDVSQDEPAPDIPRGLRQWIILYEDGHTDYAYAGEIEVINETG